MIVIPMGGLSARFFRAGYTVPKFKLPLAGRSVFAHAVSSFAAQFESDRFLFVVRDDHDTENFVRGELEALAVRDFELIVLDKPTRGQAETVMVGLERSGRIDESLTIFNIDTFRKGFVQPPFADRCDGYLEVFLGEGDHWSFIEPIDGERVRRTTEKERISPYCSNGLYHFRDGHVFGGAYREAMDRQLFVNGEIYIAPLYNLLIRDGLDVRYRLVDITSMDFCGTPDEYALLLARDGR